jgi:hypothetical protein
MSGHEPRCPGTVKHTDPAWLFFMPTICCHEGDTGALRRGYLIRLESSCTVLRYDLMHLMSHQ